MICTRCGDDKPHNAEYFTTHSGKLSKVCRECRKRYMDEWKSRHPDYQKAWREENPDRVKNYGKETHSQRSMKWIRENPDRVKIYRRRTRYAERIMKMLAERGYSDDLKNGAYAVVDLLPENMLGGVELKIIQAVEKFLNERE